MDERRRSGGGPVPPDDLSRQMTLRRGESEELPHLGVVGDTYTVLLASKDTAGR